jgi:hypothetical protein
MHCLLCLLCDRSRPAGVLGGSVVEVLAGVTQQKASHLPLLRAHCLLCAVLTVCCFVCGFTGHGLPGVLGGSVGEVLAGALLAAGLGTEAFKYMEGTGQI